MKEHYTTIKQVFRDHGADLPRTMGAVMKACASLRVNRSIVMYATSMVAAECAINGRLTEDEFANICRMAYQGQAEAMATISKVKGN